jgi:predicted phosphoribosyltransferase
MLAVQRYIDRIQAGQILAEHLAHHTRRRDVLVLALPRGGVPVGLEVARALRAWLDIFLVRKLGMPGQEEFAIGAIASGGVRLLNTDLIQEAGIPAHTVDTLTATENAELKRREDRYRDGRAGAPVAGRIVLVVDDGLATGFSMRAALKALRARDPAWLCAAVPVGAPESCEELAGDADEVVCPLRPSPFQAVGLWYDHFPATTDEEVVASLEQAAALPGVTPP